MTPATCPTCGGRASRETQTVYRHGLAYAQTVIRCWAPGRPYSVCGARIRYTTTCPARVVDERLLPSDLIGVTKKGPG